MAKQKPLVSRHLERISGDVLSQYRNIIREYVKGQHGVYALYRGNQLQYVGLASNLRSRLNQHLKDRHAGTWDHFSVYLTVTDEHLRELESLVLRIAEPKGNKLAGGFFNSEDLRPRFRRQISEFHKSELDRILGVALPKAINKLAEHVKRNGDGRIPTLAKYVQKPLSIRMTYKGKLYKAQIRRDGTIYHRGKTYTSPSSAATAIMRHPTDGWHAWKYLRIPGGWTELDELRK
jgi:Restriction Enzyme Adenine Methylase Associated/GIY-YIG catalytic domain